MQEAKEVKERAIKRSGARNLYISQEMVERSDRNQGRSVKLYRIDPQGNKYIQVVNIPDNDLQIARLGMEILFSLAEEQTERERRLEGANA